MAEGFLQSVTADRQGNCFNFLLQQTFLQMFRALGTMQVLFLISKKKRNASPAQIIGSASEHLDV